MSLMKRFRAAVRAFKGKPPEVTFKVTGPSEYDKYLAKREIDKEEAIGLLEPMARFVAIKAINQREMPLKDDIELLADALRRLEPHARMDAMQALADAVPALVLDREFKALANDKEMIALLKARG